MTARHWTEDEILAHLYGIGPEDRHIEECPECASRVSAFQNARRNYEQRDQTGDVSFEFLASQRRKIYERIATPRRGTLLKLAPGLAALLLVFGLAVFKQQYRGTAPQPAKSSDAQLVEDVGNIAMAPEPPPTEPLRALFEE